MDFLNPYAVIDIPLFELIFNLAVGLVMAVVWALVVSKSTRLIVDVRQYLPIFLLLIPSMILIITIIKSSIALSLGLVGALSIVRFRTPIKEPEELLYLFVAIAVGLGLGANQLLPTLIGFVTIVLCILPFAFFKTNNIRAEGSFLDLKLFPAEGSKINTQEVDALFQSLNMKYKVKRVFEVDEYSEILLETSNVGFETLEQLKSELSNHCSNYELALTTNARVIT